MIILSNPERERALPLLEKCHKNGIPVIAIKLETTGLDASVDDVLQIGAVKYSVDHNLQLNLQAVFNRYVNPGKEISEKVTAINGITSEILKDADDLATEVTNFHNFCGNEFVALFYNAPFDLMFLNYAYINTGISFNPIGYIDVFRIMRDIVGFADESLTLSSMAEKFGIYAEGDLHDALHDANLVGDLLSKELPSFKEMLTRFPSGKEVPEILDLRKNKDNLYEVTCRYYGTVLLDPYPGTWISEFEVFEKVNVNILEEKVLKMLHTRSLRNIK